jgi:spore maturation protein CgeB
LYSGARATFNDHWPDMRKWGFVNNRIFDALACGLPVISDYHQALEHLFGDAVLLYRNRREFDDCIERLLLGYPAVLERALQAGGRVRREHSFEVRAGRLLETVSRHLRLVRGS